MAIMRLRRSRRISVRELQGQRWQVRPVGTVSRVGRRAGGTTLKPRIPIASRKSTVADATLAVEALSAQVPAVFRDR